MTGRPQKYFIKIGDRYDRLVVIADAGKASDGKSHLYTCRCDCGKERNVAAGNLAKKKSRSCGCFRSQYVGGINTTHHESQYRARKATAEYQAWKRMIQRCHNSKIKNYKDYGGRGIAISQKWRNSYEAFLADVGRRPSKSHSIHRKDNDGNYEPGNVCWANSTEQARNRRSSRLISVGGITKTLAEWAEISGIKSATIRARVERGLTQREEIFASIGKEDRISGSWPLGEVQLAAKGAA